MTAVVELGGRIPSAGGAVYAVPSAPIVAPLAFPRIAGIFNGGDQSYGQVTTSGFVSYTASGPGTDAYTAVQLMGSFDLVCPIAASYETWPQSGRNKQNLVTAVKGKGTFANVRNASRSPVVTLYAIMESSQNAASGLPYQTFVNLIRANNWWTYETSGGTGTILPSIAGGFFEVNYSYAWGTSAGSAGLDQPICGHVYGTLSSSQGPAQSAATYFASALLTTNILDSRFTGLDNGNAAPNADGLFLDNCFIFPNGGGNLATTASWDGIGTQTNATIGAYPTAASSLISRGQQKFFATMQAYLATCNPGSTYLNFGNFGNYANNIGYGDTHAATANAMDGIFNGGLIEGVAGIAGSGWQTFMTFGNIMTNYRYAMAWCLTPKLVALHTRVPSTDGSTTSTFRTGGANVTVSTGTALEYQMMRCMLTQALMDNGYFTIGTGGASWAVTPYYDEFGDDSLTQVNVVRGYLGQPLSQTGPTGPVFANGMWGRAFDGGVVLSNPWDNGVQTLTESQIVAVFGGTYKLMLGTQQPGINTGAAFVSYTFADGDGLILLNAGALTITNVNPLVPNGTVGSFYDKQMNATGGTGGYTWALISASPNVGGWLTVTSTGLVQGTPPPGTNGTTVTVVIQVTDSSSTSVQNTYSLIINP